MSRSARSGISSLDFTTTLSTHLHMDEWSSRLVMLTWSLFETSDFLSKNVPANLALQPLLPHDPQTNYRNNELANEGPLITNAFEVHI